MKLQQNRKSLTNSNQLLTRLTKTEGGADWGREISLLSPPDHFVTDRIIGCKILQSEIMHVPQIVFLHPIMTLIIGLVKKCLIDVKSALSTHSLKIR